MPEQTHSFANNHSNISNQNLPVSQTSFFKKWGSLVVLSLALAIIVIDTTLLNVALSTIIRDLKTDIESIQWVITAYSLMLAAFTITGGKLGDIFGRKKMFMAGAAIFAVGSFLASISGSVGTLIFGESIIEGIGAALMMPATASLLVANFEGRERAIAFGVWGGIAAASAAIGPILGGYLTTHYSWRWGFRINVVVAAILLLGSVLVKEYRDRKHTVVIDWIGVIFSSVGLFFIAFGIIKATDYGWWFAKAPLTIGGHIVTLIPGLSASIPSIFLGLVLVALFVWWERQVDKRGGNPLVSMSIFNNREFSAGVIITAILSLGQSGILFSLPIFFQAVKNLDAFHTGLALLPLSLSILVVAPLSAFLVKYITPKTLIITGLATNALAYLILTRTIHVTASASSFIFGLIVYGIGMGLVMAQVSNLTLSAVSIEEAGEASGVNNTMRQVGSTLGSAIIGALLLSTISSGLVNRINLLGGVPDQFKSQLSSTLSKEVSAVEFGGAALPQNVSPQVAAQIKVIGQFATADANRNVLWYSCVFTLLGIIAALFLPKRSKI